MRSYELTFRDRQYELVICSSLHRCKADWDAIRPDDLFLQSDFLLALEQNPPEGMAFSYCLLFNESQPCGLAYFQSKTFYATEAIRRKGGIRSMLAELIKFSGMVNGNLLLTGPHGFYLPLLQDDPAGKIGLMEYVLKKLWNHLKEEEGSLPPFYMMKDFYGNPAKAVLKDTRLQPFEVQPNMVLYINKNFNSFEAYLSAMRSRYRIRMRNALGKLDGVQRRELSAEEISAQSSRLHRLYLNVASKARFNLFYLNENYWYSLKKSLKARFRLYAYEKDGRIAAFFSLVDCGEELNAHFLGYEDGMIGEHDIYLNMLLEQVRLGIEWKKKRIIMSRTAMEIKSSVGAVPERMYILYDHRSWLGRRAFPLALRLLNPTRAWKQRHPFRAAEGETRFSIRKS